MAYIRKGMISPSLPLLKESEVIIPDIAVVIADGLGSGGGEITSGNQKLYSIGTNFLLGTGHGDKISLVAEELSKQKETSPRILSERIFDIANEFFVDQNEPLGFLVIGRGDQGIEGYNLSVDRFKKAFPFNGFKADGSGSYFVGKAIERDHQRGLLYKNGSDSNIADITSTLFDLSNVAKKSAGVNDELQYGFILPEGNAALFDPRVSLWLPSNEYVNEDGKFHQKKVDWNKKMFNSLTEALTKNYNLNVDFNEISSAMQSGKYDLKLLQKQQEIVLANMKDMRNYLTKTITNYVVSHNPTKEN